MAEPNGVVNAILYITQFDRVLDDQVAERVARALVDEPVLRLTHEAQYQGILVGLRSEDPLTGQIPQPHDESTVREFLERVVRRLDALRPWPEPPFVRLGPDHWAEFDNAQTLGRLRVPILDVQNRLRDLFHRLDDGREILLLRLKSGRAVALVRVRGDECALLSSAQDVPAYQVLEEFRRATGFGPHEVTVAPSDPAAERPRRSLWTTVGMLGVVALVIAMTAAFGGLRAAPSGPATGAVGKPIDQGPFTVTIENARTADVKQFSGPPEHSLIVTVRVVNTSAKSLGVISLLEGVVAEPKPGRYVDADTMDSTGVIAGAKTSYIHPRLPLDVQLLWTLPAKTTPPAVTLAFRKWAYGQSFTSDTFDWTVTKQSPFTAKVALPVQAG